MDEQHIRKANDMSGGVPREESVTGTPKTSSAPAEEVGDEAEGLHEQTLDVDTELKGVASTDIPLNVVPPAIPKMPAPAREAPSPIPVPQPRVQTPVQPIQVPPQPVAPAPPPKAIPTLTTPPSLNPEMRGEAVEKPVTPTPTPAEKKGSPIHEPRSFAALTPLLMRPPQEPFQKPPAEKQPEQKPSVAMAPARQTQTPASPTAPKPQQRPVPPAPPAPQKRISVVEQLRTQTDSILHPLRTYRSDAEGSIKEQNASLITLAAAEESRRDRTQLEVGATPAPTPAPKHGYLRTLGVVLAAAALLAGGVGVVALVLIPRTSSVPQGVEPNHLVYVDESVELPVGGLDHRALMTLLVDLRDQTILSLGLIREIYFTLPTEAGGKRLATIGEILPKLAPHVPPELVRALDAPFLVGVHVFDGNQGFIILKTNAYEQAFSAMLAWEPSMRADLLPFMDRRMRPKLQSEVKATSTPPRVINSSFIDSIVRNHDTRVLYDDLGDIQLLYSFLNRNTIIIATNDRTLQEAITRTNSN